MTTDGKEISVTKSTASSVILLPISRNANAILESLESTVTLAKRDISESLIIYINWFLYLEHHLCVLYPKCIKTPQFHVPHILASTILPLYSFVSSLPSSSLPSSLWVSFYIWILIFQRQFHSGRKRVQVVESPRLPSELEALLLQKQIQPCPTYEEALRQSRTSRNNASTLQVIHEEEEIEQVQREKDRCVRILNLHV